MDDTPVILLEMTRGDTAEWDVKVRHPVTKAPTDLTDAEIKFVAKRQFDDPDGEAVINLSIGSGVTVVGAPANGDVHLKVPEAQTDSLEDDTVTLHFDFQVKKPGVSRWTPSRGLLFVYPDVARA